MLMRTMYKVYRVVDKDEKLKTKSLGMIKISPLLLRLVDEYVEKNNIKSRSTFIRGLIYKALNINIGDFITCETPFLPTVKESDLNHE